MLKLFKIVKYNFAKNVHSSSKKEFLLVIQTFFSRRKKVDAAKRSNMTDLI